MLLPNGDRAIVDDRKLLDYVLNPAHPVGRHHAVVFERVLGITAANAPVLKQALVLAARTAEASPGQASQHGFKYEMRFSVSGPDRRATVLAVWLIEAETDLPRLITC